RAIRRFTIRASLPEPLAPLHDLMLNLRWSWHGATRDLFTALDPAGRPEAGPRPLPPPRRGPPGRPRPPPPPQRHPPPTRPAPPRSRGPAGMPLRGAVVPAWRRAGGRGARGPPGGDRVLLTGVWNRRGAAAVLRRAGHPGRRPPQGSQRPGGPADRGGAALPE